jgi:hypothetical protein
MGLGGTEEEMWTVRDESRRRFDHTAFDHAVKSGSNGSGYSRYCRRTILDIYSA